MLRDSIRHYVGLSVGRSVTHMLFGHFFIVLSVIMSIQSVIKSIQISNDLPEVPKRGCILKGVKMFFFIKFDQKS